MLTLRHTRYPTAILALMLAFAMPALAQDGMPTLSAASADALPAPQSSSRTVQAPDRNRPEYQSVQATFTVTSDADSGAGSLREAIDAANASPGLDAIEFAIGGGGTYAEIFILTRLPHLTDPVTINGDTQGCDTSQGLCIRLDGAPLVDTPEFDGGLVLFGGSTTLHGLLFTRFYRADGIPAIQVYSASNTVTGCYFGTDRTGMVTDPDGTPGSGDELGNGFGLVISTDLAVNNQAAVDNVIGGSTAAERNVIAGSTESGISVTQPDTMNNLIIGNYLGTNASGTAPLGNGAVGILLGSNTHHNTVKDNLASGNESGGIKLQSDVTENLITGNLAGTDASGSSAIPNGTPAGLPAGRGYGLQIFSGATNLIEENVFSGNLLAGIVLGTFATTHDVTDNIIRANRLGTDRTGTLPIANGIPGVPDIGFGIVMVTPPGNTISGNMIGGASYADANVIGFNTSAGLGAEGPGVTGNVINHNLIGFGPGGEPIPNGILGVLLRTFVNGNQIGDPHTSPTLTSGNIIGFQPIGVGLGADTQGNEVLFNQFVGLPGAFVPVDLGLDGPTANDPADPDTGPNQLQNAPVVQAATLNGNQLTVTFLVDTAPSNAAYPLNVRFFGRDVQGGVQGYIGLGEAAYASTHAQQSVTATFALPAAIPPGLMPEVVAIATDANGNSGELSLSGVAIPVELSSFEAVLDGTTARLTWATASETNNAGFEVEARSSQDGTWNALGFVAGQGTTTEAQIYAFTVRDLAAGTHTFRLKQLDFDGTVTYSGEVEVSVGLPGTHVLGAAYPNPFNPSAQFTLNVAQSQVVEVALYNVIGQRVALLQDGRLEAGLAHTLTIDGSGLASGAYFVRISGETFQDGLRVTLMK